jgi:hypothetical protein
MCLRLEGGDKSAFQDCAGGSSGSKYLATGSTTFPRCTSTRIAGRSESVAVSPGQKSASTSPHSTAINHNHQTRSQATGKDSHHHALIRGLLLASCYPSKCRPYQCRRPAIQFVLSPVLILVPSLSDPTTTSSSGVRPAHRERRPSWAVSPSSRSGIP